MDSFHHDQQILALLAAAGPGSAVKALLTLRNISQRALANRLGMTTSEISRVITGKRRTRRVRNAVAQELGVPVEVLFGTLDPK